MDRYLKINWSIRLTLWFLMFVMILLIISNIYWIIFFDSIKETLTLLGSSKMDRISIPIMVLSFILQFTILYIVSCIVNYKRWAIVLICIFVWLPGVFASFWSIVYISFCLYEMGLDRLLDWLTGDEKWIFYGIGITLILLTGFFIKLNRELIRLYKSIKSIDQVESINLQDIRPKFLNLLLIAIAPIILWSIAMIVFYTPVIPLDLPEWYFKIEWFDFDNPIYTDQKICQDFEIEIGKIEKISQKIKFVDQDDIDAGVILAKKAIFAPSDMQLRFESSSAAWLGASSFQDWLWSLQVSNLSDYEEVVKQQKEWINKKSKLKTYIENYPEQWNESLRLLRSQFTIDSITRLQKLTQSLPQNFNCNVRDDSNIASELFPSLTYNLSVSRFYDTAIRLALLENQRENAIDLLRSAHEFNIKFYRTNTTLVKGMIGITLLKIEFWSAESILQEWTPEEISIIREIYSAPYDIDENQLNAWKWERYFLEHILTGRWKSIKQVSIPYLFNGADMLNRADILLYAGAIAWIKNDSDLLDKIDKNKIENNTNFLTPVERSFIGQELSTWKSNNLVFAKFYNSIGKMLMDALLPIESSYRNRYKSIGLYQNYIRYDLLWIWKWK